MPGKNQTSFGYTETSDGYIEHLRIVGVYGIEGMVVMAPVALVPKKRDSQGLPYAERLGDSFVYVLPGGLKVDKRGVAVPTEKPVESAA